jgi:hypothetical protein
MKMLGGGGEAEKRTKEPDAAYAPPSAPAKEEEDIPF